MFGMSLRPGDTLRIRPYSYRRLDPKMDIDGDGGRRGFGLRGQRRGTERSQKSIPVDLDILDA
jgi:hypothetical protein